MRLPLIKPRPCKAKIEDMLTIHGETVFACERKRRHDGAHTYRSPHATIAWDLEGDKVRLRYFEARA